MPGRKVLNQTKFRRGRAARRMAGGCPYAVAAEDEMMGGAAGNELAMPAQPLPLYYRPQYIGGGASCGPACDSYASPYPPLPPQYRRPMTIDEARRAGLFGISVCVSTTVTKANAKRRLDNFLADWSKSYISDPCVTKYPAFRQAISAGIDSLHTTINTIKQAIDAADTKKSS